MCDHNVFYHKHRFDRHCRGPGQLVYAVPKQAEAVSRVARGKLTPLVGWTSATKTFILWTALSRLSVVYGKPRSGVPGVQSVFVSSDQCLKNDLSHLVFTWSKHIKGSKERYFKTKHANLGAGRDYRGKQDSPIKLQNDTLETTVKPYRSISYWSGEKRDRELSNLCFFGWHEDNLESTKNRQVA